MSKEVKASNIDDVEKEMQVEALDSTDVTILKLSSNSPYSVKTAEFEKDIEGLQEAIKKLFGVEKTDMGLAPISEWDLHGDRERLKQMSLTVARVTKIMSKSTEEFRASISIRQSASYLVGKHATLSAEDIEEDMRVGIAGMKMEIALPLPAAVDPTVSLMEVDERPKTTYADVGGCGPELKAIREVVELPLLHPERFARIGVQPPRSCILYGVPGVGKTLTARAIANKTNSCFIRILGSQLNQKYVGEGARMIREIFELAREKPSCILFFDECDSFASRRSATAEDTGDSGVERTMLELINELDGFNERGNIFVLMASNRPDTLDEALLRPGRLDRRIEFKLPDLRGREEIFRIQTRRMAVEPGIRFKLLARLCQDASGAEIASVCREAGISAMREERKLISELDFTAAINKVIKGYRKFVSQGKYLTANAI